MSNQYAGTLFSTFSDMVDAAVEDWLTGCGAGSTLAESLADGTDAELADALVADNWIACSCNNGDGPDEDGDHRAGCLEDQGVDRDDVLAAIERLRAGLTKKYTITVGETLVGETDDRDEAGDLLTKARDMSARWASHYGQPVKLTEDGRTVDLLGSEGLDW